MGDEMQYPKNAESGGEEDWLRDVPKHLREGIREYIDSGRETGGLLMAIFCNDLRHAVTVCHPSSTRQFHGICKWIYNYAPESCCGSPERVREWMRVKKLVQR